MNFSIAWIRENWLIIIIPLIILGATLIALFWLRRRAWESLERWLGKSRWEGDRILVQAIERPSVHWCIIISVGIAMAVSVLPMEWKIPIGKGLWTIFLISFTVALLNIVNGFARFYELRLRTGVKAIPFIRNAIRIIIIVITILSLLDTWGVSTTPILLLIAVVALAAALIFRDTAPNFFASFQINASRQIKLGDYIKIESGEEGYVTDVNWRNTRLKTLNESIVIVPNSRLVQSTIINYGRPLKKAKDPFRFYSRLHLTQLTGLKAKNLPELAEILKNAPDDIIYFHMHHFLEEQYFTVPQLSNDFAVWVDTALGNDVLAERMASIDPFDFSSLGALRERLVSVISEYLATSVTMREAAEGREFHFMKAVSVILPTTYVAHDLREFTEALRKISLDSLYFHIFESKLRLGKGLNDFTVWMNEGLGDAELAEEVARINPYTYTLEGLRSSLIQRIEKRIK